jgi:hypothetical protein
MLRSGRCRKCSLPAFELFTCTSSALPRVFPAPEDEAKIRAALAELDRGAGRTLTAEEAQRLAETGEWPEWCDSSS